MTPLNISGLFLLLLLSIIIFFFQKECLKSNKVITFIYLVLTSGLVVFLAEFVFQIIRFSTIVADTLNEKLYSAGRGVIVITLIGIIISLIIGTITRRKGKLVQR